MPNTELQEVSRLAIGINNFDIKDSTARTIINEIINAIGANNDNIAERINNLHDRSFDAEIKISSANESEISNIVDGLYKLQYVTITGEGTEATETLNNSAILIQKGTNQYLIKDGQISSRTKTNNTWGTWTSTIPNDSNLVHKTGNETINGTKTFGGTNNIKLSNTIECHVPELLSGNTLQFDWIRIHADLTNDDLTLQQALDERNNVQADWNQTVATAADYIKNKPTIPTAQIQADWNQTTTTATDYIKNKPDISVLNNISYFENTLYVGDTRNKYLYLQSDDGININVLDSGNITLNTDFGGVYFNNKEIAVKDDIPTVSTTVTQNDANPVSGSAVYDKFEDLIGAAPAALDTLQEIASALNNDSDLAGTLTTQISNKVPKVSNPTTDNFASFNSDGTIKDSGVSASSFITSIKTVNNESLVGTGNIVVSGLPQVSASDNGKILMVVNGQWQLVSPSALYSGQGVPNNAQGNNGDLYMQTD